MSSQTTGEPATQPVVASAPEVVGEQVSVPVQKSPSSQAESTVVLTHASVVVSQLSVVHEKPSSQVGVVPGRQPVVASAPAAVGAQVSVPVQKAPSSQEVSSGVLIHEALVSSHVSVVQDKPSSQSGGVPGAQPVTASAPAADGLHCSMPLQNVPSPQETPSGVNTQEPDAVSQVSVVHE